MTDNNPPLLGGDGSGDGFDMSSLIPLLGFMHGIGQASAPSRLPVTRAMVLGGGAGGLAQGLQAQQQMRLINQEATQRDLANQMTRWRYNLLQHPEMMDSLMGSAGAAAAVGAGGTSADAAGGAAPALAGGAPGAASAGGPMGGGTAPAPAPSTMPGSIMATPSGGGTTPPLLGAPAANSGSGMVGSGSMPSSRDLYRGMLMDQFVPGLGKDVIGKQLPGPTDYQRAVNYANSLPDGPAKVQAQQYAAKLAGIEIAPNTRAGSTIPMWDPTMNGGTGGYRIAFKNPSLPEGYDFKIDDAGNPIAFPVTGALEGIGNVQSIKSTAEQRAALVKDKALKSYEYGLEYGQPAPGASSGAPPAASSFAVPQVGAALGAPGPRVQSAGGDYLRVANGAGPSAAGTPDAPLKTAQGTIIPPLSSAAPIPTASKELDSRIPEWNKTQTDWAKALPSTIVAEQRALAIADALKKTESGAFATEKANIKASLHAVGIDLPDDTFGSPAQVETALKDNFSSVLEQIKAFSSRPAAAEVTLGQKNFSNPNLQPEANLNIIAQTVGQMRWERALMNDFKSAKSMGWRDPQDFQQAWLQLPENALQGFIDRAKSEIGPLKGMPGGPGSAATFDPSKLPAPQAAAATAIQQNYKMGKYGKAGSAEARAAASRDLDALVAPAGQ